MANSVRLDVITPSKLFYRGDVELVIARTLNGDEGFMANHMWACKLLDTGELWIQEAGEKDFKIAAISGGFIQVQGRMTIFTDAAEWPEDIDVERARQEQERATEWLKSHRKDEETTDEEEAENVFKAKTAVQKSHTRVDVAGGGGRRKKS